MRELLLTLGHNSSAILIEDGEIVDGCETERLTGIKADSQFPAAVIDQLPIGAPISNVYVTHWEPFGELNRLKEKYWQPKHGRLYGANVLTHEDGLTHHDTHAWGAIWFAGPKFPQQNTYVIVCDGFGNFGEHLSIYTYNGGKLHLEARHYGYRASLGLMYQYTTAFLGLKMHEDEYKLLGYEVHLHDVVSSPSEAEDEVIKLTKKLMNDLQDLHLSAETDPMLNLAALPATQKQWIDYWLDVCFRLNLPEPTSFTTRVVISYIVQRALENVLLATIRKYPIKNLLCSGGVFYNVKLNSMIVNNVPGKVCFYPLAGDQGNALGLYYAHNPEFAFPGHLTWWRRTFIKPSHEVQNLFIKPLKEALQLADDCLKRYGFVNFVHDRMEFGPRALCHTTTFALPTTENVDAINSANGRASIMPMAPVVPRRLANIMFEGLDKVWRSAEYMVVALRYRERWGKRFVGAAHPYSNAYETYYTGRPQVIDETHWAHDLVSRYGVLINTSFNVHGQPIVCTTEQIIKNHVHQWQRDNRFTTIIAL